MGNYFFMSTRFNKCDAADFGLLSIDPNTAINPADNSIWKKTTLYDFGWGKENGFYKVPLPCFNTLFELVLYSTNRDDIYGAATIILENFPDSLLCQCEIFANDYSKKQEFKKMVELFGLKFPINRCSVVQKKYEQIQSDYLRWKRIADIANSM